MLSITHLVLQNSRKLDTVIVVDDIRALLIVISFTYSPSPTFAYSAFPARKDHAYVSQNNTPVCNYNRAKLLPSIKNTPLNLGTVSSSFSIEQIILYVP